MSEDSMPDDDLREEYGFSAEELRSAERGRYARRFAAGERLMPVDPDVAGEERARAREEDARDDPT